MSSSQQSYANGVVRRRSSSGRIILSAAPEPPVSYGSGPIPSSSYSHSPRVQNENFTAGSFATVRPPSGCHLVPPAVPDPPPLLSRSSRGSSRPPGHRPHRASPQPGVSISPYGTSGGGGSFESSAVDGPVELQIPISRSGPNITIRQPSSSRSSAPGTSRHSYTNLEAGSTHVQRPGTPSVTITAGDGGGGAGDLDQGGDSDDSTKAQFGGRHPERGGRIYPGRDLI